MPVCWGEPERPWPPAWMFAVFNTLLCIVNGVGLVRFTTVVNLLMLWAVRIPSAYMIRAWFDGTWIMLCFPISFFFGMCCMIGYVLFSKEFRAILNGEKRKGDQPRERRSTSV